MDFVLNSDTNILILDNLWDIYVDIIMDNDIKGNFILNLD